MDFNVWVANSVLTVVALALTIKLWRMDFYFAVFFSMLTLYALMPAWGYFFYPEISQIVLRMHFGNEPLVQAAWFTTASLVSLFAGYFLIFRPMTRSVRFNIRQVAPAPGLILIVQLAYILALACAYIYYIDVLSYSNASDEEFLNDAGILYKLFWVFYKFSTFIILISYALIRTASYSFGSDLAIARTLLAVHFVLYVSITASVGSRTDPLALSLGLVAYEYYFRKNCRTPPPKLSKRAIRRQRMKWLVGTLAFVASTIGVLSALEVSRSDGAILRDDLEASALAQGLLLKDYYWPFHVLIGAISYSYVDPLNTIRSIVGNSLAFLGIDYLQAYVVNQWDPGGVTRTASPALYAFTEGFLIIGWSGFVYNGIIFAAGLGMWRLLSRSSNESFNAIGFAICIAVAATVARSQSSYFIKNLYLWFLPALVLYAVAAGFRPTRVKSSHSPTHFQTKIPGPS
jgi:hypothetical protein